MGKEKEKEEIVIEKEEENSALIISHIGQENQPPFYKYENRIEEILKKIKKHIKQHEKTYKKIYYLRFERFTIFPRELLKFRKSIEIIESTNDLEEQFWIIKRKLMQNNISKANVCGVSRYVCVEAIKQVLNGNANDREKDILKKMLKRENDEDKFEELVIHKIKSKILEKLSWY
jgi:predicted XRE-type DNA-binding protein